MKEFQRQTTISLGIILALATFIIYLFLNNNNYNLKIDNRNVDEELSRLSDEIFRLSDEELRTKENEQTLKQIEIEKELEIIEADETNNNVLLSVNGKEITQKDWDSKKVLGNFTLLAYSEKELLIDLISSRLLIYEAERLDLIPSEGEIIDYVNRLVEMLPNEPNDDIERYIQFRGISKDEYIAEERKKYEKAAPGLLKKQKLGDYINQKYKKDNNKQNITSKEYYDNYKQKLLDKAKIKVYDKDIEKLLKE